MNNKKNLETGIKNVRNVLRYIIGKGSISELPKLLETRREIESGKIVFFIDHFFKSQLTIIEQLGVKVGDELLFIDTVEEPTTETVNLIVSDLKIRGVVKPAAIVGMGGGITMDIAKAVSNLLGNGGKAEDYQGWDLLGNPGIYKIAIPTLSGTGAEATRTCVMTNKKTGLKLGMNSDFTVYDQIIMDPDLTLTVPRDQYFFTGMDAYIHCMEAGAGRYRNSIGDAYSRMSIDLCREVFMHENMMNDLNREKLMVASYLGGCAIATTFVGVVHPFSAGLSVVLNIHHCVANCIVMRAMEFFYPDGWKEFWNMAKKQSVNIPEGVAKDLSKDQYEKLYEATIIHEKPLINALGANFKDILTKEKVKEIFQKM